MKLTFPKRITKLLCLQKGFLAVMTGLFIVLAAQIPAADMKIAFTSNRDGNSEIYVMNANGTNPVRLTDNPAADSSPTWSPDGTQIVYGSNRGNEDIYIMDADGANPRNLSRHAKADRHPDWSLDGTKIVFTSDRDGDREIYVVKAGGGRPIQHREQGREAR